MKKLHTLKVLIGNYIHLIILLKQCPLTVHFATLILDFDSQRSRGSVFTVIRMILNADLTFYFIVVCIMNYV